MRDWLLKRPIVVAWTVAATAYVLLRLLFLTPLLKGDGGWIIWALLLPVIGVAVWLVARRRTEGVLPMLILVAIAGALWFFTGFGLACSQYGECM